MALLQGVARQPVTWFAMQACGGYMPCIEHRGWCVRHTSLACRTDTATSPRDADAMLEDGRAADGLEHVAVRYCIEVGM